MTFRDRAEAGRLLAGRLERLRDARPVVLGLTRGGVPVALEVARALDAPLEPMVVRKLGAPESPEYALGAIAEGGAAYVSPEALLEVGLRDADVEAIAEREGAELARLVRLYRGGRPFPDLRGRAALVVDDGVATGATARAAARAARRAGAARVVLAAPVVAAESVPGLRQDFDDVVAVELPVPFQAVGLWYERFGPVGDDEVLACLARAAERGDPAGAPTP
jgi:putative phosphoribosyl transferase